MTDELLDDSVPCAVCAKTPTHRFGVSMDDETLTIQVQLCLDHGDGYVLRAGRILGEMLRDRSTAR